MKFMIANNISMFLSNGIGLLNPFTKDYQFMLKKKFPMLEKFKFEVKESVNSSFMGNYSYNTYVEINSLEELEDFISSCCEVGDEHNPHIVTISKNYVYGNPIEIIYILEIL